MSHRTPAHRRIGQDGTGGGGGDGGETRAPLTQAGLGRPFPWLVGGGRKQARVPTPRRTGGRRLLPGGLVAQRGPPSRQSPRPLSEPSCQSPGAPGDCLRGGRPAARSPAPAPPAPPGAPLRGGRGTGGLGAAARAGSENGGPRRARGRTSPSLPGVKWAPRAASAAIPRTRACFTSPRFPLSGGTGRRAPDFGPLPPACPPCATTPRARAAGARGEGAPRAAEPAPCATSPPG